MKKIRMAVLLVLCLVLTGCGAESGAKKTVKKFLDALVQSDASVLLAMNPVNSGQSTMDLLMSGVLSWEELSFNRKDDVYFTKTHIIPDDMDSLKYKVRKELINIEKRDIEKDPERYKIIIDNENIFEYEDTKQLLKFYEGIYEITYADYLGNKKTAKAYIFIRENKEADSKFEIYELYGI